MKKCPNSGGVSPFNYVFAKISKSFSCKILMNKDVLVDGMEHECLFYCCNLNGWF